jgi:alkanesulfonate monooxygenase
VSEFILSGFPNLEESRWVGEGLVSELRRRGLLRH